MQQRNILTTYIVIVTDSENPWWVFFKLKSFFLQGFCPGLCLNLYQQRWHKVHTEKSTPVMRVTGLLRNGPLVAGYQQGRVKHPVLYFQYTCSRWDLAVKWRHSLPRISVAAKRTSFSKSPHSSFPLNQSMDRSFPPALYFLSPFCVVCLSIAG